MTKGWGCKGETVPLEQGEEAPEMAQGTLVTEGSFPCLHEAKGNQVTVGAQISPNMKHTPHTAGLAAKYATTAWDNPIECVARGPAGELLAFGADRGAE